MSYFLIETEDFLVVCPSREDLRIQLVKIHEYQHYYQHYSGMDLEYKVYEWNDGNVTPLRTKCQSMVKGADDYLFLRYAIVRPNDMQVLNFSLQLDGRV